jgi:threonine/homoserine/homoserine lactone efflux protein
MSVLQLTPGPLALFALVASATPGPNNLLLMRSGAMFGVRRSAWHLLGVQAGFGCLVLLVHLGVGALLFAVPGVFTLLHWACFAYLLWLAWLILGDARTPRSAAISATTHRPMSFFEAVMFQLINPKAWMMAITVATSFYGSATPTHLDLAAAIALATSIGGSCMLTWTIWGASIDRVLKQPQARAIYGYVMAALVVATAFWMLP